jgi:hypothetical protein
MGKNYGRFIITNAKHGKVVFLPDAKEGSEMLASDLKGDLGEMVIGFECQI